MNLKLKQGLENTMIYLPFENRNCLGKFIDPALYQFLYRIAPDLFDVIVEAKKATKNDILINDTESSGSSDLEGKIA